MSSMKFVVVAEIENRLKRIYILVDLVEKVFSCENRASSINVDVEIKLVLYKSANRIICSKILVYFMLLLLLLLLSLSHIIIALNTKAIFMKMRRKS